jgi:hypothetical protein
MHGSEFRRDLKWPASSAPLYDDDNDGLEPMPAELAAVVRDSSQLPFKSHGDYRDFGCLPDDQAAFMEAAFALGSLHGVARTEAASGPHTPTVSSQRPAKAARKRVRAPRPDPNRHAHGIPSRYTCFKVECTGVVALDPTVALEHCDAAKCVRCGAALAYCAVCDGFFDAKRVVSFKKEEGFKYARNGQHSLEHEPRKRIGGRKYVKVPRLRPGVEPEEC